MIYESADFVQGFPFLPRAPSTKKEMAKLGSFHSALLKSSSMCTRRSPGSSDAQHSGEISESASLQNPKGSLLGNSDVMNVNVNLVTPEKISASSRRRYETQIQTRLQNLSSNLQNKSNDIEVLAADLHKETLINFLSLEFDSEEQFNISMKTLLSRLPKQRYLKCICEQIYHFKISKRVAVVVLHSYRDDYYKILL